jgi:DNA-binding MltR family transcriptional regulator
MSIKKHLKINQDPNGPSAPLEILKLNTVLNGLHKESDRGACLISGSYLDELLEDIIKDFLIECDESESLFDGPNAPLGTFFSKSLLAYSLGLIEKAEVKEIGIIRKIRNDFAHAWVEIKFDNEIIAKEVRKLPWRGPEDQCQTCTPRERFIMAVAMLIGDLLWRQQLVQKERRTIKDWTHKAGTVRYYK